MSELVAIAGATFLGAATLPQGFQLVRTRSTGDFGWTFTVLNFVGLALLTARSWIIEEWAFLAINTLTTLFWGLALAIKLETWWEAQAKSDGPGQPSAEDVLIRLI